MGTLNYTLFYFGPDSNRNLAGTRVATSDAFTTTTSATNVEDGSGDITTVERQIFRAVASEPMWIAFGGRAATVGNDFYMRADVEYEWEISPNNAGLVSVIDVS